MLTPIKNQGDEHICILHQIYITDCLSVCYVVVCSLDKMLIGSEKWKKSKKTLNRFKKCLYLQRIWNGSNNKSRKKQIAEAEKNKRWKSSVQMMKGESKRASVQMTKGDKTGGRECESISGKRWKVEETEKY